MKRYVKRVSVWVVLMGMTLIAFGGCGDDGHGPTGPTILNVAGNWSFSGQISSNNCVYLQGEPGFTIGSSATEGTRITQTGTSLTASHTGGNIFSSGDTFSGTLNGSVVTLAQTNPLAINAGTCSAIIGGGMDIQTSNGASGNGSVNLTTAYVGGNCAGLGTLPCSVVWTGTWTKTSGAKLADEDVKQENALIHQLEQLLRTK